MMFLKYLKPIDYVIFLLALILNILSGMGLLTLVGIWWILPKMMMGRTIVKPFISQYFEKKKKRSK